jgi:acetyl esterase/lipase
MASRRTKIAAQFSTVRSLQTMTLSRHPVVCLASFLVLAVSMVSPAFGPVAVSAATSLDYTGVQVKKDIPYLGAGSAEKLDLYRPEKLDKGKRYPAVVIIHGGGWSGGTKGATREQNFATNLVRASYICVSIDYTLATPEHHTWPEVLYQCKSAVQFLRKNANVYQVDATHIGVIGGSAGGHLALMVGLTSVTRSLEPPGPYRGVSSRVQAVADFYGPTNLSALPSTHNCEVMLGVNKSQGATLWEQASPANLVTRHAPPVLVVQGSEDKGVPVSQAELILEKLKEAGVPHDFILVKGAGHSFDFQPSQQDLRAAVIAFFDKYLKSKAEQGTLRPIHLSPKGSISTR